jgi:hypothetical protein
MKKTALEGQSLGNFIYFEAEPGLEDNPLLINSAA